jgi:hypothetical protein
MKRKELVRLGTTMSPLNGLPAKVEPLNLNLALMGLLPALAVGMADFRAFTRGAPTSRVTCAPRKQEFTIWQCRPPSLRSVVLPKAHASNPESRPQHLNLAAFAREEPRPPNRVRTTRPTPSAASSHGKGCGLVGCRVYCYTELSRT